MCILSWHLTCCFVPRTGLELRVPPAFASPHSAGIIGIGCHALFINYAVSVLELISRVMPFLTPLPLLSSRVLKV